MGTCVTFPNLCAKVANIIVDPVNDIVVACKSGERFEGLCKEFDDAKFDVKDLGRLHYFSGMTVIQDDLSGSVRIGQSAYVCKVLERFGMQDAKSVVSPVDISYKLVKAVEDDVMFDKNVYQSAVGSLFYFVIFIDGYETRYCVCRWKCS